MKRDPFLRRFIAALTVMVVLGSTAAFADPVDDIQNTLVSVSQVAATGIGPTKVMVSWHNDSAWPNVIYRIEMSKSDQGPWQNALPAGQLVPPNVCNVANICIKPVGSIGPAADPAPRWFRVVPIAALPAPPQINAQGVQPGDPTKAPVLLEGKPSAPDPAILGPLAPTHVLCNGDTNDSSACVNVTNPTFTWTDNSDENHFLIVRVKALVNPNFNVQYLAKKPADTTSFTDSGLDYAATYWYRIVATREREIPSSDGANIYHETSFTNCTTSDDPANDDDKAYCAMRVETPPVPPPTGPQGLTVQFIAPNSAKLTWIDQAPPASTYIDEDGWYIELASQPGQWESQLTRAQSPGQGTVTYTDRNIPPDTLRCYRVRGWRLGPSYSQYSPLPDDPNGTGICIGTTPRAPSKLTALALSNAAVLLKWKDNSSSETSFVIERCTGTCSTTDTYTQVGEVPANVTVFTDTSTDGLTTYTYRVVAVNPSGRSAPSNLANASTPRAPIAAPSNLNATGLQHSIRLTWTDNATTETGFRVEYRDPGSTDWQLLTNDVPHNVTTYRDRGLAALQTRCYRVRTIKADPQVSDASNEDCAKTLPPAKPDAIPSDLTARPNSETQINLSFTDNATNEDGYTLEYQLFANDTCANHPNGADVNIPFNTLATIGSDSPENVMTVNYTAQHLVPHTAYFFRVKAFNQDGESAYSPTSACAQTYGPPMPKYKDPSTNSPAPAATRCDFTITSPATGAAGDDQVGGLLVYVNGYVPNTSVNGTDTLYVVQPGGTVPGMDTAPSDSSHQIKTTSNGGLSLTGDDWKISYHFLHGVKYTLHAIAYTYKEINKVHYASAQAILSDVTVLADCPLG